MKWNTHKIALMGVLTAGAIIIAILESFIPSIGIPGVKLGLANIVILIILYEIGIVEAVIVDLSRVLLVGLLSRCPHEKSLLSIHRNSSCDSQRLLL